MTFYQNLKKNCIALTGGVATGKSYVASILKDLGYEIIDADLLIKEIWLDADFNRKILNLLPQINSLSKNGLVQKELLRPLFFKDPWIKTSIENEIYIELEVVFEKKARNINQLFFYEAALIFEKKRELLFKAVWATYCPKDLQVKRLMERNHLNQESALDIIKAQMDAKEKADLADFCFDTSKDLTQIKTQVSKAVHALLN